ncbi:histidine phosphatase family protein [Polaromonas sp.]|uniref:histidine phosphatase family protein n=1 Tax=Polaromonas sp. TaxID=1869339 RepID=UPI0027314586|nr:histidine phosphatase family protein [Polaromonas sp.]MDP1741952.1 histidine phosphatase family protein [Polaromonas sp.]
MKLWLVRHAPVLLAPGSCYGALDVPAEPQATQRCAQKLSMLLPQGMHVSTSPLQRCEQLTQALQGLRPDLIIKTDARLREMNFGNWEGRRWDAIAQSEFDAWTTDFAGHAVGGHGETVQAVMARVGQAFNELRHDADAVWVTHAGIIRAAQLLAQGIRQVSRADQWPLDATACGQWRTLELSFNPSR